MTPEQVRSVYDIAIERASFVVDSSVGEGNDFVKISLLSAILVELVVANIYTSKLVNHKTSGVSHSMEGE